MASILVEKHVLVHNTIRGFDSWTQAAAVGLLLTSSSLSLAQVTQRVNDVAPGRGQEILRNQPAAPAVLPPDAENTGPRPYPLDPNYSYVGNYVTYGGRRYGSYGYPYYNTYGGYYQPVIQPVVVSGSQNLQVQQQPTPTITEFDRAMYAFEAGKTSVAIDRLLEHLKANGDDFVAMRLIGLMYLEEKQPSEAAARIAFAYKRMPELARRPLDAASLGLDFTRLREMVVRASRYANRMKTGSAWLVVSVLTQAEGRTDIALANLSKAEAAGLDAQVVSDLRITLSPMEPEQLPAAAPLREMKDAASTPAPPTAPSPAGQKPIQNNPKNP